MDPSSVEENLEVNMRVSDLSVETTNRLLRKLINFLEDLEKDPEFEMSFLDRSFVWITVKENTCPDCGGVDG